MEKYCATCKYATCTDEPRTIQLMTHDNKNITLRLTDGFTIPETENGYICHRPNSVTGIELNNDYGVRTFSCNDYEPKEYET